MRRERGRKTGLSGIPESRGIDSDELAELEAERAVRAAILERFQPIPLPPVELDEETDADEAEEDVAGQCLRHAGAAALRLPASALPRVPEGDDRWERWTHAMRAAGYVVEVLSADDVPPRDHQPWCAVVAGSGDATHALPCIGLTVIGRDELRSSLTPSQVISAFRVRVAA
jgi:hypothetical protein